ncbi:MAG TPA: hypothetical protein VM123_05330 [archaeon]|nr:hypothetical protein [archaeon]
MKDRENTFIQELEVFRTEAESVIQFFYAFLSINASLADNKKALRLVNETPLFWRTNVGALQLSFFIALGRIFDQNSKSKHNIDKLLRVALDNMDIFSKEALEARKIKGSENSNVWIDDYMKHVYVPTFIDFRRLRKYVSDYRKVYNNRYREIRNMVFAHKGLSKPGDVQILFSNTNTRKLQYLSLFPIRLYNCLWELFHNGRKPVLRPIKYSVRAMRMAKIPAWQSTHIQEHMVHETEKFFQILSSVPNQ